MWYCVVKADGSSTTTLTKKGEEMKRTTGRLTEKNGKWYAVINLYTTEGKRKEKRINLDLEAKRGSKTEANCRLTKILARYNSGELYLQDTLTSAERGLWRVARLTLPEYIAEWLEEYKYSIAINTYACYKRMLESRIIPYFKESEIAMKDINGKVLNDFYSYLLGDGLSGSTVRKYHNLIHLAYKCAIKNGVLPFNPRDQANRPKATRYVASYYNEAKLKELLTVIGDDPLRIVVLLTVYYGVRRSEVLGIKWSAIDEEENLIHLRHKIIEDRSGKKTVIRGMDIMKTKSSVRSLPLFDFIKEELHKERERQEEMKRVFRGAYNRQYEEYVCVDAIGNLITPNYVTQHFKVLLQKHGLDGIRFHDLRHSCATLMLANGEDLKKIQSWLGHSTITITLNVYSHTTDEGMRTAANRIDRAMGAISNVTDENNGTHGTVEQTPDTRPQKPPREKFEPRRSKYRRRGTGSIHQVSKNV